MPDKLRDSTLQNLQIFMDEDQKKEVSQNYTQEEDTWVLNDDISKETRENLNEDFSKAMMMVSAFSEDSEQGQAMVAQMGLPEGTDLLTALAQMPEEAVQQIMYPTLTQTFAPLCSLVITVATKLMNQPDKHPSLTGY